MTDANSTQLGTEDTNSNRIRQTYGDTSQEVELLNTLDKRGLGSDWSSGNILTLVEWLNIASLYILILDKEISYYKKFLNRVTIVGLILSTITSTISLSQLSLSETDHPNISLGLKIGFSFTSIFTTIASGTLKIMSVQENLDTCLEYYKQWNSFAVEISGQLQLPIHIRKNALSIIIRQKSIFKNLFTTRLPLTENVKQIASNIIENKTYVENRYKDKHGTLLLKKRCCSCSWFAACFHNRRDIKIRDYFSNRLSVYYMYQDIIVRELETIIKVLNDKDNTKLSYRIEPTKIVVDISPLELANNEPCSNEPITRPKTKSLLCSINPNINMNLSENSSQQSNSKDIKITIKPLNNIADSNLEDTGDNVNELEEAINKCDNDDNDNSVTNGSINNEQSEAIQLHTEATADNNT